MRPTRTATFVLTLVLSCAPVPAPFAQSPAAPKPAAPATARAASTAAPVPAATAAIDRLFKDAVGPDGPGMAIIVVNHGKTLYRAARGMANVELGVPLRPDHVFRMGSVTKQFTAAAIMMLAEEGKLAVTDPITKFLPEYPTRGKTITVEHLLTHTSGIQSYTDMAAWRGRLREDFSLSALVDLFKNEPMLFSPGEKWRYNNSGYILLGAIVEKVSGKSYADFVKDRIFTPLGMTDTRYDVTDDVVPRRASGYGQGRAGVVNAPFLSMTQPYAAGALMSTVDDLAKWDAALTSGKVLSPASLEKTFTNYRLADGSPSGYGYGWQIASYDGRPVQEHGGGIPGFRAYVLRIPSGGVYVAVMANIVAPTPDLQNVARRAAAVALGKPLVDPPAIVLTAEQLEAYVGRYVTAAGTRHVVTRDGTRLFVQFGGGARTELFASGNEAFFEKGGFARVRFQRDAAGKVVRLDIDNFGVRPAATRDDTPEKPKEPAPAEVKVDPATYDAFVGEYELMPDFILTVTREGDRLMTQATGQPKVEVFPSSPTEFFLKVVEARISFVKDATGTVTGLVLHQGGRDMPAKKIR